MTTSCFNMSPVDVPKVETKYRRIVTKLPVPESLIVLKTLDECESNVMHGQMPIVWDRAEGFQVYDAWGNMWLDFTSTIFVANAGHADPRIIRALNEQLNKPLLHSYNYATEIRAEFLKYLINSTPTQFEKACLFSGGTETTECAIRLMRVNGLKNGKTRLGIIAFEGCYHGETMGARMLSYSPKQKEWIGYHDPNIHHLPFPYPWRQEAVKKPREYFERGVQKMLESKNLNPQKDLCGFMVETFQGWGALFYPKGFLEALFDFARSNDLLIAFDEMQAGFGRTGKLFGYMHYGVEPDILCCGKGASSSVPLSIVLASREVLDNEELGAMYSTHSANPIACAAGLANLKALLEDGLIENTNVLGELFAVELEKIKNKFPKYIKYSFAKGLIAALHCIDERGQPLSDLATRICETAMRKGLLVVCTGRESIKLSPPLCITKEALLDGLAVLDDSISECIKESFL